MRRFFLVVHSKSTYPGCSLSNFAEHRFSLDGIPFRCMEGLLQSLKAPPGQLGEFCRMDGITAKKAGAVYRWQEGGAIFHWNGAYFSRYSRAYRRFLRRAYDALLENADFSRALLDSGRRILRHPSGALFRQNTCLTRFEFLALLYRARRKARRRAKTARSAEHKIP